MGDLYKSTYRAQPAPRPPSCTMCGSKMTLLGVEPGGSKYTNLETWTYRCEPCEQTTTSLVAGPTEGKDQVAGTVPTIQGSERKPIRKSLSPRRTKP